MRKICLCAAITAALSLQGLRAADTSVEDITTTHYTALLEELEAYIDAHPNAEDIDNAYESAIQAAFVAGQNERVHALLKKRFDGLKTEDPLPAQELAQVGMMRVQFAQQQGTPGVAKEVYSEFNTLMETHDDPVLKQVASMLEGMVNRPEVGDTPELKGTTLDGNEIALKDYRGKVVLLDFWATWCGPCVEELPNVKGVYETYHDKGFEIVGISLDRSRDTLTDFIAEEDIPWPNLLDSAQETSLADRFGVTAIPTMFLLDREGKIVAMNPRGPELEKEVSALFGSSD